MALSKKIILDNGMEINYHIIAMVSSYSDKPITTLYVHSFTSKEVYKKAIKKYKLIEEQQKLIVEFQELAKIEEPSDIEKTKLDKLQTKINKLADKIEVCVDYKECIANEFIENISYQDNLSIENLQEILKKESSNFNLATTVA